MKKIPYFIMGIAIILLVNLIYIKANGNQTYERMELYKQYADASNLDWYYIAAIDQFERNTKQFRDYCPKEDTTISICFSNELWSGINNPKHEDTNVVTIKAFYGLGLDGNGDGKAERLNGDDAMTAMISHILDYGINEASITNALSNIYNKRSVDIIIEIKEMFKKYNRIDLGERVYPIAKGYDASMTNSYGDRRGYKGVRSHEGVDIFADYGTPVVSTAYGYIEIIGWNELGGYRIGIRDVYGTYEYYAHLQRYAKDLQVGDIVQAGQLIGFVGSTGYGKEGTSGKFPPHLHFGFYKYDGRREWAFDPYSYLRKWPKVKAIK